MKMNSGNGSSLQGVVSSAVASIVFLAAVNNNSRGEQFHHVDDWYGGYDVVFDKYC